ncbi:MAG TPA: deoxyribodipyrimidine photolyase [Polyangiales bacterium]|nr:deoxyribodipyrimidine photolyase [Polyangiales bacterium]
MFAPDNRVRVLVDRPPDAERDYVLYWMIAARRPRFNFALDQAAAYARALKKPLVVLEALRVGYPWASDRLHAFVLQGMAANAEHFAKRRVLYYPYVERKAGEGSGLLEALAKRASVVLTDDFPCFFIPHMLAAAARKVDTRFEAIDGNGLLPLALAEGKSFYSAYIFRRFMQKHVANALEARPREDALLRLALPVLETLPAMKRWPRIKERELADIAGTVSALPIDHDVSIVPSLVGGTPHARRALTQFLDARLCRYEQERSHPDSNVASGLSPYLHFGHLSVHEILAALADVESWDQRPRGIAKDGKRQGFWGLSGAAESFLDELVTFRELALNTAATMADFDRYESLPAWARKTLGAHASDRREHVYALADFEAARIHDPLWNAAQRQLLAEGRIQNYLRMLWGKQILAYSKSPESALEIMIELNNKHALDGRDPNSYAGMFWILGRYDRPWAPERAVFGSIRYMSSASTMRKLRLKSWLSTHGDAAIDSRLRGTKKKIRPSE